MKRLLRVIVSLGLLSLLTGTPICAQGASDVGTPEHPIVWVEYLEDLDDAERGALSAIAEALFALTGLDISLRFVADSDEKISAISASDGDTIAFVCEDEYVELQEVTRGSATPRLACVWYGAPYYFASVYAPRDSGIETLQDLNGRIWIYNDTDSTTGYTYAKSLFERREIRVSDVVESGCHGCSLYVLLEGGGDFFASYGGVPQSPDGWRGRTWQWGDDPEMWIWDRGNNDLYSEDERSESYDLRGRFPDYYGDLAASLNVDLDTILREIGVVACIGPFPNSSLTFGPGFPADVAGRIVDAAQRHVSTEAGLSLWRASPYRVWGFEEIDDSFYDCYRSLLGLPIPNERPVGPCYYNAVDAPLTPAAQPSPPVVSCATFPDTIGVDQVQHGLVWFEDPDGDMAQARFEVLGGDPGAVEIQPGTSFDPGVHGQTDGAFRFTITSSAAQTVTLRLTLVDEAGLESDPYEFTFEVQ